MALLSVAALYNLPNNTIISDTQVLKNRILRIKSQAIGYQKYGSDDYFCIILTKSALNQDSDKVKYTFKSDISLSGLSGDTLCFDYLGRPFDSEVDENLTHLLHKKVIITLKYRTDEKNITVFPISGEVN